MPSNLVNTHMYQCISEAAVASIIFWNVSRLHIYHTTLWHILQVFFLGLPGS